MSPSELYKSYLANTLHPAHNRISEKRIPNDYGEICLYKYIDHKTKDAELLTASELKEQIDYFEDQNIETVVLHYGHYFNADFNDLMTLNHYAIEWFSGQIISFSPEEIIFLAIRGDKTIEELVMELAGHGTNKVLGFLPQRIVESNYYADMDELFIEDRHAIFEILLKHGISFNYPFNLGQIEFAEEFEQMLDFVKKHRIQEVVLQPNPLIDTDERFDYEKAQALMTHILDRFYLKNELINSNSQHYTAFFFPKLRTKI